VTRARTARAHPITWNTMPQFMLVLYESPASISQFKSLSPEEMQKALEKYMAWAKKPFTVGPLGRDRHLRRYHLLLAVRGHLLLDLGRRLQAGDAFRAALECDCSEPERRFLAGKLQMCGT
jgi:predicted RNA polymerase sigma factor